MVVVVVVGGGWKGGGRYYERFYWSTVFTCQFVQTEWDKRSEIVLFFSFFLNEETYSVGWKNGCISTQPPHSVLCTCPFVLDFCPYNQWQT